MKCWGARFLVFTLTQTTISADCSKMNFIGGDGVVGAFTMTTGLIWWRIKYTPPPTPPCFLNTVTCGTERGLLLALLFGEGFLASIHLLMTGIVQLVECVTGKLGAVPTGV